MSQIKELNFTEKVVTTLSIIGGILLFGLSLTKCQSGANLFSGNTEDVEVIPAELDTVISDSGDLEKELLASQNESAKSIDLLQDDLSASKKLNADLTEKVGNLEKENDSLMGKLRSSKKASKNSLIAPAAVAAAAPAVGKGELKALKQEVKGKNGEIDVLQKELEALNGSLKGKDAELNELKRKIQSLNTEKDALSRTTDEEAAKLQSELDQLSTSIKTGDAKGNKVLEEEKAKLTAKHKKEMTDLKNKHELDKAKYTNELKSELSTLRVALRKEKTKKVFANSSEDLAPSAQKLITELSGYESAEEVAKASGKEVSAEEIAKKEKGLAKLYKGINSNIGSRPKVVVNFASGSSSVDGDYQTKISELLKTANPDTYFIAVGYADTTGSAKANKSLSSKRATRVAEVMKPNLKETQFVQAFYLGQTARFGAPENNRVVEIWEISE